MFLLFTVSEWTSGIALLQSRVKRCSYKIRIIYIIFFCNKNEVYSGGVWSVLVRFTDSNDASVQRFNIESIQLPPTFYSTENTQSAQPLPSDSCHVIVHYSHAAKWSRNYYQCSLCSDIISLHILNEEETARVNLVVVIVVWHFLITLRIHCCVPTWFNWKMVAYNQETLIFYIFCSKKLYCENSTTFVFNRRHWQQWICILTETNFTAGEMK